MNAALPAMRAMLAAGLIAGTAMWMGAERQNAMPVAVETGTTTVSDYSEQMPTMHDRDFIVDRYGNPIEEAVGDYRIDPRGDIFERHSPATEIPRLPQPSA